MANLLDKNSGYLQQLQRLNLYKPSNVYDLKNGALVDTLTTIINGMEGVSSGFQNSLAARVLMPNTPIQQIGTVQLAKNLAKRAASNLRNLVLPTLNIQGTNISLLKPNYWNISNSTEDTSISGLLKSILDYTPAVNPIPFISPDFSADDSNNYLKGNRGQGQIDVYLNNINRNDFSPDDEKSQYGGEAITQTDVIKGNYDNSILALTNRIVTQSKLDNNGYQSASSPNPSADNINRNTLGFVNRKVTESEVFGANSSFGSEGIIARGDGTFTDDSKTVFLRQFNYQKRYEGTQDLMKFKHGAAGTNSVLQTVYPNIAPASTDKDVRNLMFSIENLAYAGNGNANLAKYETGMNGGRAMWFPPYGLEISETISANWNNIDLIGRSEPIYTYNNRERQLSLSFMLIVDYPSALNENDWKSNSDNTYNKFFRQDNPPNIKYTVGQIDQIKTERLKQTPVVKTPPSNVYTSEFRSDNPLVVHYDNNSYTTSQSISQDVNGVGQKENNDFFARINKMIEFLNTDDGAKYAVKIGGYASKLSTTKYNQILSFFRANDVYKLIIAGLKDKSQALDAYNNRLSALSLPKANQYQNKKFQLSIHGETRATNQNSTKDTFNQDYVDRKVTVWLEYSPALDKNIKSTPEDTVSRSERINQYERQNQQVTSKNIKGGEHKYFERLKADQDKQLVLQKYSEQIDWFHPVFHSQTPEDFNSRLTFLQQCTLQGTAEGGVSNSIFGKPPVCVLRLGDFFHTKMIITTINVSYEPIWDVNPEGIGMQPMICYITMDCKILGGQDLAAPLTKLQNALSYNFYANTSVYHKDALISATEQETNTAIQNSGTTRAVKVNSQTANLNQTIENTANKPYGDLLSGYISYTEKCDEIVNILNRWSGVLLLVKNDIRFSKWLNTTYATINVNEYNVYFNSLSPADKVANTQTLGLITAYASDLAGASNQFFSIFGTLSKIQMSQKDAIYKLGQDDGSFVLFGIMLDMFNNFLNTIIYNINAQTSSSVAAQLAALQKYSDNNLQNIPYTT